MRKIENKSAWGLFGAGLVLCIFLTILLFYQGLGRGLEGAEAGNSWFSVVFHGIAIDIPEGYACYPYEDSGLLVYTEEDFSMLLWITEESFADLQKSKESLPENARERGVSCLTGIKETRIRKQKYLYYMIEYNERIQYVIYTAAGTEHSARVVLDAGERSEQDALEMAACILESTRDTDQKDTSIYDYYRLQIKPVEQGYVSDAVILDEQGEVLAVYGIPEGFYTADGEGVYKKEGGYEQSYVWLDKENNLMEGNNIYVTVSLRPKEKNETIEEVIDQQREFWNLPITAVRRTEQNEKPVCYIGNSHSAGRALNQTVEVYEFYAVMDLGDGNLYRLEAWAYDQRAAMELEAYEAFLQVER